ncbi:MAG: T9SS type A sorting domain-containing protein [Melioribacter sp.]|nr:T9SS type A sorting domain-containing protein [Melioribacter sp.]
MKRTYAIIVSFLLITKVLNGQIIELCQGKSTSVMNGEYNIMNNVWGANTPQCIELDLDSSYFKVTLSGHNNGNNVAAYPAIFKGCHWGWCTSTNNPLPKQIKFIERIPIKWEIDTKNASGTWNAALDIWFAELPTGYDYSAEMMIWLDYNGGAAPAGSKVTTVEISGIKWDLYFVAWSSWNYIAFKAVTPLNSVQLDLRDFINESLIRGYLYTTWYLHAIEAGFEIWSGGQNLTTNHFFTNVYETSSPINFPPLPFRIQVPVDNAIINTYKIEFKWQKTTDPDLDDVEYTLHIKSNINDTIITNIKQNSYSFDGTKFFKPNTLYTWYVNATDGKDTTKSTNERSFTITGTTDIDEIKLKYDFQLYQNYPNPFNPNTTISYKLPKTTFVTIKVYDALGSEVAILVNETKQDGPHYINFDASKLPQGVYFYQMCADNYFVTKKMVLIK